jgi:hypothetical protein
VFESSWAPPCPPPSTARSASMFARPAQCSRRAVSRGLSSASAAAHQQFRVQTYNAISPVGLQVYTADYKIATVRPAQRSAGALVQAVLVCPA